MDVLSISSTPFWQTGKDKLLLCALLSLNAVETNKTVKNYSILALGCVEPLGPALNLRLSQEGFRQNTTKGDGEADSPALKCCSWDCWSVAPGLSRGLRARAVPWTLPRRECRGERLRCGGRKAVGREWSFLFCLRRAMGGQDMHMHALKAYFRLGRKGLATAHYKQHSSCNYWWFLVCTTMSGSEYKNAGIA